jgi:endonuclease/exonuclease/phosphatase (EEP) superfamily protein YafD
VASGSRRYDRGDRDTSVFGAFADIICGLILVWAAAVWVSRLFGYTGVDLLVLGQAALPLTLWPVWLALAIAVWHGQPIRAAVSALLCVFYGFALLPALGTEEAPGFAAEASAQLSVFAANVYVDNENDLSAMIRATDADVLVLTEFAKTVEAPLRRSGALAGYAHMAENGGEATWRTVILSRLPFASPPRIVGVPGDPTPGTPVIMADIQTAAGPVRVVGAHPMPYTVDGADTAFASTTRLLRDEIRASRGVPLVVTGDFNGTRWLPSTGQLFDTGITSVHEARGFGLSASWPMLGSVPRFMRLDHMFFSDDLWPTRLTDVNVRGSDHVGMLTTFAIASPD